MRIATVSGIPLRLHWSFLGLALVVLASRGLSSGLPAAADSLVFGALLFGSVLLHELGHALVGRFFGVRTRDITLYPFGGIARMEAARLSPRAEVVIALAGPLTNLLLAGLALLGLLAGLPLGALLLVNLSLALFNLLPAWPMDGGRVLRGWLSPRLGAERASRFAMRLSRALALLMLVGGLVGGAASVSLVGLVLLLSLRAEAERSERLRVAQLPSRWEDLPPSALRQLRFPHPVR